MKLDKLVKSSQKGCVPHRLRREVSACLGVLAILFHIAMPFANAFAADLGGGEPAEVICAPGGRLISLGGERSVPAGPMMACEFCLVCQFAVLGYVSAPDFLEHSITFSHTRIFWSGFIHLKVNDSSDFAVRPVRAPPVFV